MTKGLHSFMFEAGSLQTRVYSYCLCAITKHDKWVSYAHTADILFSILNSGF